MRCVATEAPADTFGPFGSNFGPVYAYRASLAAKPSRLLIGILLDWLKFLSKQFALKVDAGVLFCGEESKIVAISWSVTILSIRVNHWRICVSVGRFTS